mmetsp:Transcript_33348/g.41003  ORF Transcript_33348/g.41003 Transcript_33348/m.41003 type:complete len:181 (+) Transcript_33348:52-594(+)
MAYFNFRKAFEVLKPYAQVVSELFFVSKSSLSRLAKDPLETHPKNSLNTINNIMNENHRNNYNTHYHTHYHYNTKPKMSPDLREQNRLLQQEINELVEENEILAYKHLESNKEIAALKRELNHLKNQKKKNFIIVISMPKWSEISISMPKWMECSIMMPKWSEEGLISIPNWKERFEILV